MGRVLTLPKKGDGVPDEPPNPLTDQALAVLARALDSGAVALVIIYQCAGGETGVDALPLDIPALRKGMILDAMAVEDDDEND